jgi:micrococcal nuclease
MPCPMKVKDVGSLTLFDPEAGLTVNGSEARNYAALGVWWYLRASLIDQYRRAREDNPALLNSRRDYAHLVDLARQEQETTVFTELRECHRAGGHHVVITIGSLQQPFQVFVPDADMEPGQTILRLLDNRYLAMEPHTTRAAVTPTCAGR